jgi:hypothetical protein
MWELGGMLSKKKQKGKEEKEREREIGRKLTVEALHLSM